VLADTIACIPGRLHLLIGFIWGTALLRAWSQLSLDALQAWSAALQTVAADDEHPPAPVVTPRIRSADELLEEVFPHGLTV
jgi:hypothetical protein